MSSHGTTQEQVQGLQDAVELQDASCWASGIVNAAINMYAGEFLEGPALALWDSMGSLDERYGEQTHIGYIKALDALIASPGATQEVLRRARAALVEADTRLAAYAPPAEEVERRHMTSDELDRLQLMKDADELICVYANNHQGAALAPAAEALYVASDKLIESDEGTQTRVGYVLALDAFLASPGALEEAVRNLRRKLVESDPALAVLDEAPTEVEQPVPLAVNYAINGEEFRLEPNGTMYGFGRELKRYEVFNLLSFFRMPGVAALIDRLEIEQQTEVECAWQAQGQLEVTREQAIELLKTDEELMTRLVHVVAERYVKEQATSSPAE
jgi:hypothetical protein